MRTSASAAPPSETGAARAALTHGRAGDGVSGPAYTARWLWHRRGTLGDLKRGAASPRQPRCSTSRVPAYARRSVSQHRRGSLLARSDVIAPSLWNLGAGLQQVGPLIRGRLRITLALRDEVRQVGRLICRGATVDVGPEPVRSGDCWHGCVSSSDVVRSSRPTARTW